MEGIILFIALFLLLWRVFALLSNKNSSENVNFTEDTIKDDTHLDDYRTDSYDFSFRDDISDDSSFDPTDPIWYNIYFSDHDSSSFDSYSSDDFYD